MHRLPLHLWLGPIVLGVGWYSLRVLEFGGLRAVSGDTQLKYCSIREGCTLVYMHVILVFLLLLPTGFLLVSTSLLFSGLDNFCYLLSVRNPALTRPLVEKIYL